MISENIARLRREANMTQEKLASAIGVSTQAVSKWENGATMPDIMLLPIIADQFGVSVDELYGRKKERIHANTGNLADESYRTVMTCVMSAFSPPGSEEGESPEDSADKVIKELGNNPDMQTMYYRESVGSVYLSKDMAFILKGSIGEALSLLDDEKAVSYLSVLCGADVRKVYRYIIEGPEAVTVGSAAAKCGISEERAKAALEILERYGHVRVMDVSTGEGDSLTVYLRKERERAALALMIMKLAARLADYHDNYYGLYAGC